MGNCVFNNIAIAARYTQRVHGLERVFIINMDVHHENGSKDAFHDEPDVFFLSVHQSLMIIRSQCWLNNTRKIDDIVYGNGEGSTLNLTLPKLCLMRYDGHVLNPHGKFQFTT
nr:histone deacetylase 14 isoform X2 [Tanacetum cinerariifolium]